MKNSRIGFSAAVKQWHNCSAGALRGLAEGQAWPTGESYQYRFEAIIFWNHTSKDWFPPERRAAEECGGNDAYEITLRVLELVEKYPLR